jgi:hypothetical protein
MADAQLPPSPDAVPEFVPASKDEVTRELFFALHQFMARHPVLPEAIAVCDALVKLIPDLIPPTVKVIETVETAAKSSGQVFPKLTR